MAETADGKRVLIIGGGYCGLAAAVELTKRNVPFVLAEKAATVGGLSPTIELAGELFELGPHIYFDKDPEVVEFWRALIGEKFKSYDRRTRLFYAGKFIKSPLSIIDTLVQLGPIVTARILFSFAAAKWGRVDIENAADWVTANFGRELYERFFRVYNEKIWGLPSTEIDSQWAGQRIKTSLAAMVYKSIRRDPEFIVKTFAFPDGGSQTVYSAQERLIRANHQAELRLATSPLRIERGENGFSVWFDEGAGPERFSHVISTIHLSDLAEIITYPGQDRVLIDAALERLVYRDLILVNLVFGADGVRNMNEHWIDIHDPSVLALRVTNFSNYLMDGSRQIAAIGVEYNCFAGDAFRRASNAEIIAQSLSDLRRMGLVQATPFASSVVRVSRAYPVYFKGYRDVVDPLLAEFAKADGLVLAGRNAMYKWNNMHHSVKTGILAAQNVLGAEHDLGKVRGNVTIGKDSD
jgi:protoporphyrinogen oxidase